MTQLGFLLFYLLGMVPTYILPYFGSNSIFKQAFSAGLTGSGVGLTFTALHLGALASCVYVAWARRQVNGKTMLVGLPVIAAVFDLVPVLSMIPLVPTILHIVALVMGFAEAPKNEPEPQLTGLAANPVRGLLAIYVITAVSAIAMAGFGLMAAGKSLEERAKFFGAEVPAKEEKVSRQQDEAKPLVLEPEVTQARPSWSSKEAPVTVPVAPSEESESARAAREQQDALRHRMEQERVAADAARAERQAKQDAERARLERLNTYLASQPASALAQRYAESYVGYLTAGDVFGAIGLFDGSRTRADGITSWIRAVGGVSRVEYDPPKLIKSTDSNQPDFLRVDIRLFPPEIRPQLPSYDRLELTLNDSGDKFVEKK